jgi:hypothetical protein
MDNFSVDPNTQLQLNELEPVQETEAVEPIEVNSGSILSFDISM